MRTDEWMNIYFAKVHTFVHNQLITISTGIHTSFIHVCIAHLKPYHYTFLQMSLCLWCLFCYAHLQFSFLCMVLAARYIRSYMLITTIMSLLLYKGRPIIPYIIGSEQERRNSIVNILELCPSCTNPSTYARVQQWVLILCICMCVLISITWVSKQRRGSPTDYALGLPLFWFPMSMCTFMGNTYSLCSCYAFNCFGNQQLSHTLFLYSHIFIEYPFDLPTQYAYNLCCPVDGLMQGRHCPHCQFTGAMQLFHWHKKCIQ